MLSLPARRIPALLLVIGISLGFFWTAAQGQKSGRKTVWDGVYTTAQAEQGRVSYEDKCGQCHKDDLSGYDGVLKSERFMEHWRESSLDNFFATMSATMPRDAPGSLSEKVYLDILAFVLHANDFPTGANDLTSDALRSIQVEGKTGPQEVPAGALVDVVGCLTRSPDDAWILTRATEPVRTRNPNDSTAEELKAWDVKPLGTHTFGLMDAAAYLPESQKGHKVEAKGLIIRGAGGDHINLTALQMTDSKCGS
jgi:hypothetical protein